MNERIRELLSQAFFETEYDDAQNLPETMERFAELIVRECVGVVEGGRFLHDEAPTAMFARECSSAIKRHFGVKE